MQRPFAIAGVNAGVAAARARALAGTRGPLVDAVSGSRRPGAALARGVASRGASTRARFGRVPVKGVIVRRGRVHASQRLQHTSAETSKAGAAAEAGAAASEGAGAEAGSGAGAAAGAEQSGFDFQRAMMIGGIAITVWIVPTYALVQHVQADDDFRDRVERDYNGTLWRYVSMLCDPDELRGHEQRAEGDVPHEDVLTAIVVLRSGRVLAMHGVSATDNTEDLQRRVVAGDFDGGDEYPVAAEDLLAPSGDSGVHDSEAAVRGTEDGGDGDGSDGTAAADAARDERDTPVVVAGVPSTAPAAVADVLFPAGDGGLPRLLRLPKVSELESVDRALSEHEQRTEEQLKEAGWFSDERKNLKAYSSELRERRRRLEQQLADARKREAE